jgi:hypothetical protein
VTPQTIAVFDSTGSFLESIGRAGDGPGEYREISAIRRGSVDSILVLDANRRVTVIGPGLQPNRTIILQTRGSVTDVALARAAILFGTTRDSYLVPPPRISIVDAGTGAEIGTAGGSDYETVARYRGLVADNSTGHMWAVRSDGRELDRFDVSGNLITRYALARGPAPCDAQPVKNASPPRVAQIARQDSGLIWLLLSQRNASLDMSASSGEPGIRMLSVSEVRDLFTFWLEGVDPATGQTTVCQEFDDMVLGGFAAENMVYALRDDAAGEIEIDILLLKMTR